MDAIENDRYYTLAKDFIQEHINKISPDQTNAFTKYYEQLTPENARETYYTVAHLYGEQVKTMHDEFMVPIFKFSGGLICGSLAIMLATRLFGCIFSGKHTNSNLVLYADGCSMLAFLIGFSLMFGAVH